ncbi:nucleotidyltransferase family protein [Paenibacillus piri]|uniref:Polymerase beta nucleotidyltransferase domain-containing protein n=1 Tax=Paenibacillus piri TaxID=2547395 RepID=A0A4R5KXV0_9BACL|nr:hypothetical protein [Paenibacillus piri]TDG00910.1 hypothetical protein E1757_04675 [Paenibacillus piri]
MNVIDSIIEQRSQIMSIAAQYGVSALKLFGSVLARQENTNSDIDFIAVFASLEEDEVERWHALTDLEIELKGFFNRKVQIIDSKQIPDLFRPQLETDPVDIMLLKSDAVYRVTPKTSKPYYIMLDKLFKEYEGTDIDEIKYANIVYTALADQISFQFSKLLKLDDNDLRSYEGFSYIEVLNLCDKLFHMLDDQDPQDLARFKDLLPPIKEYVAARVTLYI